MDRLVRVVARRGDAEHAPENTLPAFESAIAGGADAVELDVHPTADGRLVVHHYYHLGSSDNGSGLVHEKSMAELKSLDSGSWFHLQFAGVTKPSLSEVFELCRGKVQLEIDLKHPGLDSLRQVIREIEDFNLVQDVELTTGHTPLLPHIKTIQPKLRIGTFIYQPPAWMPVNLAQQHAFDWALLLNIDVVHLHTSLIDPEFVQRLHEAGYAAAGSNLDSREEMLRGIQAKIDSFSTGRLAAALQVRNKAGRSIDQSC